MTEKSIRHYIDIVEFVTSLETAGSRAFLSENAVLNEGAIADKIRATMAKAAAKFQHPDAEVLKSVAAKALKICAEHPEAVGVIRRALSLGQARVLTLAMIGICGAFIAMGPASAQAAATKLEPVLTASDVDAVVSKLKAAGIAVDGASVPSNLSHFSEAAQSAAKALRAIHGFKFDGTLSSMREIRSAVVINGAIEESNSRYVEEVSVSTPSGLVLMSYKTIFDVVNGRPAIVDEIATGVGPDLEKVFTGISPEEGDALWSYISGPARGLTEDETGIAGQLQIIAEAKAKDVCMAVAAVASKGGKMKTNVRI